MKDDKAINYRIPMKELVRSLDDEGLSSLHAIAWNEIQERTKDSILKGYYPAMTDSEKQLSRTKRVDAVMAYYHRNKDSHRVHLLIAKKTVEMFLEGTLPDRNPPVQSC